MITLIEISVLAIAVGAGILVGTDLTTRSIDHSFRQLAQRRRVLEERERAVASIMARHQLCPTCSGPTSWLRQSVYQTTSGGELLDDDD